MVCARDKLIDLCNQIKSLETDPEMYGCWRYYKDGMKFCAERVDVPINEVEVFGYPIRKRKTGKKKEIESLAHSIHKNQFQVY